MRKRYQITAFLWILLLTACGGEISTSADAQASKPTGEPYSFEGVRTIHLKEKAMSLSKEYDVSVDGKKVATVKGKVFTGFGDVLTLKDTNGNVLATEKEVKRTFRGIDRLAMVYDKNGEELGYFGEELIKDLFKPGFRMHFFDAESNEIGYAQENYFSLLKKFHFYDMDEKTEYTIKENWSVLASEFDIYIEKDSPTIPIESAILMVCVQQAIDDAEDSED